MRSRSLDGRESGESFSSLRRRVGRLVTSNYDISERCNLRCEGCLFFAGDDYKRYAAENDLGHWSAFFKAEAERGVNFGYFAGAEPSLELERLRAAHDHISGGVVFSNGLVRIPDDITFRIHISLWGGEESSIDLRGAGNAKALRNYANDPRAAFVFTINALNIGDIVPAVRAVAQVNSIITFSLFSPTTKYLDDNAQLSSDDARYFRKVRSSVGASPLLTQEDLKRATDAIEQAKAAYPGTVKYSSDYHSWITQEGGVYRIDPQTGVALNCGSRLSDHHRHYNVDLSATAAKCCSPNLDCRGCRAYAMGYATYLKEQVSPRGKDSEASGWLGVWSIWAELFLSRTGVAVKSEDSGLSLA